MIRTRIVGAEGKHADHLTRVTALQSILLVARFKLGPADLEAATLPLCHNYQPLNNSHTFLPSIHDLLLFNKNVILKFVPQTSSSCTSLKNRQFASNKIGFEFTFFNRWRGHFWCINFEPNVGGQIFKLFKVIFCLFVPTYGWVEIPLLGASVTRSGDLLDFGQLLNALGGT